MNEFHSPDVCAIVNPAGASRGEAFVDACEQVLSRDGFAAAVAEISRRPQYAPTPLRSLPGLARTLDDAVRHAAEQARAQGWTIVSDTSYPGYREIPVDVMHGYGVMAHEIARQLPAPHVHRQLRELLALGGASRVLLIGSEGDSDPAIYRRIVGRDAARVLEGATQ